MASTERPPSPLQQRHDRGRRACCASADVARPRRPSVLLALARHVDVTTRRTEDWEATNLHTVATRARRTRRERREETRGSHWREDFPDRDDERWRVRLVTRLDLTAGSSPAASRCPCPPTTPPPSPPPRSPTMTLPAPVADRLRAAGLDPVAVEDLVRRALAEDLGGGVDVTSVATIPAEQRSTARPRRPRGGRGRGPAGRGGRLRGGERRRRRGRAARRRRRRGRPRRRAARGDRTRPATCSPPSGRALNLLVPPVRRRHGHPRAGSTRSRAPARRSATPARPRPACGRWRSTPCAAAAASTTGCRCRTPPSSRTTTWSRPAAWPPRSTPSAPAGPGLPVEVEVDSLGAAPRGPRRRRRPRPARQHDPRRDARGRGGRRGTRAGSRPPAGCTLGDAAAVAATGVDYLAVGALTHSAPVLDIGARPAPIATDPFREEA